MPPFAPPFTIPPISTHTHTLILLHDRGASGQEFGLDMLNTSDSSGRLLQTLFPGTKFVFPTANQQCVTVLGGPRMAQWFDNYSTVDPSEREALQFKGLRESSIFIHDLIENENEVPLEDILLGGFSQGSAMALYALLTFRSENRSGNLGGFVGMSGWLPLRSSLDGLASFADGNGSGGKSSKMNEQASTLSRNQIGLPSVKSSPPDYQKVPIFMVHGETDTEVSLYLAEQAVDTLRGLNLDVTLRSIEDLGHEWKDVDEINDIVSFLTSRGVT